MERYTIERVELEKQTLGSWYDSARNLICKTLELPWRNNKRSPDSAQASCIDYGLYHVIKQAPKPGREYGYFRVTNVEGRQGILVHRITNWEDLLGCIGVGTRFLNIDKDVELEMVESSKKLEWMYQNLPNEFELLITKKP